MRLDSNIELRVVFHRKACESWHRNWAITAGLTWDCAMECFAGARYNKSHVNCFQFRANAKTDDFILIWPLGNRRVENVC